LKVESEGSIRRGRRIKDGGASGWGKDRKEVPVVKFFSPGKNGA